MSAFWIVHVSGHQRLGSSASQIISISDGQHSRLSAPRSVKIVSTPDRQHPGCPTQARRSKGIVCYLGCATWTVSLPGHQCAESPASRTVRISDCLHLKSSAFWIVNVPDVLRYRCGPARTLEYLLGPYPENIDKCGLLPGHIHSRRRGCQEGIVYSCGVVQILEVREYRSEV